MADPRNHYSYGNDDKDDRAFDHSDGQDFDDSSSSKSVEQSGAGSTSRSEIGLEERLTEIFVDEGDGDLLLQNSNREDMVLQWLQALDMQVMGACRSDERLKPLLKMNASNGVAEDSLLAHLSQHFEPVEVGMLARCFCIPLVSIRVGKINKQGTLLCPAATRGNLNLTVLPTSSLRLSFIGDDGLNERLCTVGCKSQCSIAVSDIPEDDSGRSFLIEVPDGQVFYFWCSEKSKLLGIELLAKMKDLLMRKPSIAELTGISESRLGCFATHLRAYLVGSTLGLTSSRSGGSHEILGATNEHSDTAQEGQIFSTSSKSLRSRHTGSQTLRTNSSFQGSLSPRSSSFKEGLPRSISSLRTAARDKLRRRGDSHFSAVDNLTIASPVTADSSSNHFDNDKLPEIIRSCSLSSSCFLDSLGKLAAPPTMGPATQLPYIGQGYLVSAGPTISTTIPPLHPKLVSPLIPKTDSVVEKSARETLRLLISGSSQTSSPLLDVLPAVLTNADDNSSMFVTGSRGLYSGTRDVDVIASSIAAMGLVSLSGRSDCETVLRTTCSGHDSLNVQEDGSSIAGECCSDYDDDVTLCSVRRDERVDQ